MKKVFTPLWMTVVLVVLLAVGMSYEQTNTFTVFSVGIIVAIWFAITIHELGHVIFGKLAGFQFVFFTTGPLFVEKTIHGVKFKQNKNWTFFGGVAMMSPPELEKEALRKRFFLMVSGGPLISLLGTLLFYVLFNFSSTSYMGALAIANLAIFLATCIPLKGAALKTDGYQMITLLKNDETSEKLLDESLISSEVLSNKKPEDWNLAFIKKAKHMQPSIENILYASMIYYYEIQKNGFEAALHSLSGYLDMPITDKNKVQMIFLTHMKQLKLFLSDQGSIEELEHLQKLLSPVDPLSLNRGKAMIAYLKGDTSSAKNHLISVQEFCEENIGLYGFYHSEILLTKLVEEKMNKGLATKSV